MDLEWDLEKYEEYLPRLFRDQWMIDVVALDFFDFYV
jgi:hypothetical protein